MAFTKKHTAVALAGAALIQALAYGGYKIMNPSDTGGATTEQRRALDRMAEDQRSARERLEYWTSHPEAEDNPEWQVAKILQGRASDDKTLTEYEKARLQSWWGLIENTRRVASGKSWSMNVLVSSRGEKPAK